MENNKQCFRVASNLLIHAFIHHNFVIITFCIGKNIKHNFIIKAYYQQKKTKSFTFIKIEINN